VLHGLVQPEVTSPRREWSARRRELPVDERKIDRSFIADMAKTADAAIVQTTIDPGRPAGDQSAAT
jgi:predicted signal transduction protein with EAL and GGDEF domain